MHLFMHIHRYAPSVIGNGDGVVAMYGDLDMVAVAAHSLVYGVIHKLLYKVMQPVEVR